MKVCLKEPAPLFAGNTSRDVGIDRAKYPGIDRATYLGIAKSWIAKWVDGEARETSLSNRASLSKRIARDTPVFHVIFS
jgi:hypothetical protein